MSQLFGRSAVATIKGLSEIAENYDLILCDVWGVLHDGKAAHQAASEALIKFRNGKDSPRRRVILVSNAPRPWTGVLEAMDRFEVPREAYDAIVTSGDLTHDLLARRKDARVFHLGPERDLPIYNGTDVALVSRDEADLVVCTGLFDDNVETVEDYQEILAAFRGRDLQMICANPDLVVERDKRLIPCAGLIAAVYAEIGGEVLYTGKPYPAIYDAAFDKAGTFVGGEIPRRIRTLAIGDAIRTDVAGAHAAGISSLLVARGIHAEELGVTAEHHRLGDIADWLTHQPVRPDAVIERLVW